MATSRKRKMRAADPRLKRERLELRLAPAAKGARRVLDDHERMVLTGTDRDAFLKAVLDTPQPTDRLVAALKRHRDLFG